MTPGKMAYKQINGLMVAEAGPVTIDGVRHRVDHGFVVCYRSLNGRAWNVTMLSSTCQVCYPDATDCRVPRYSIQGELFDFDDHTTGPTYSLLSYDFVEPNSALHATSDKVCGTCASMDTSLPGCCPKEIGRCIDPVGRSYYLKPENKRPNDCLPEGDPHKFPTGGSWAYVARDSCACDKHRPRGRKS